MSEQGLGCLCVLDPSSGHGTGPEPGIEQGVRQCSHAPCPVCLGAPGPDHLAPAGSWVAVARAAASLPKASAQPCSSSMTSRRCGSRCECASAWGPGSLFPPGLGFCPCLTPGNPPGRVLRAQGQQTGGAP